MERKNTVAIYDVMLNTLLTRSDYLTRDVIDVLEQLDVEREAGIVILVAPIHTKGDRNARGS